MAVHAPGIWALIAIASIRAATLWRADRPSTGSHHRLARSFDERHHGSAELNRKAAELEPGCDGLIVQDHFQGIEPPIPIRCLAVPLSASLSPMSRITFPCHHGRHRLWHAAILDAMASAGYRGTEITVGGGAGASDLCCKSKRTRRACRSVFPASRDAPSVGAAVLAAHGAGHFSSIDDGIAAMVRPGKRIEPLPRARQRSTMKSISAIWRFNPALKSVSHPGERP